MGPKPQNLKPISVNLSWPSTGSSLPVRASPWLVKFGTPSSSSMHAGTREAAVRRVVTQLLIERTLPQGMASHVVRGQGGDDLAGQSAVRVVADSVIAGGGHSDRAHLPTGRPSDPGGRRRVNTGPDPSRHRGPEHAPSTTAAEWSSISKTRNRVTAPNSMPRRERRAESCRTSCVPAGPARREALRSAPSCLKSSPGSHSRSGYRAVVVYL